MSLQGEILDPGEEILREALGMPHERAGHFEPEDLSVRSWIRGFIDDMLQLASQHMTQVQTDHGLQISR
jgi:hypothetical protein